MFRGYGLLLVSELNMALIIIRCVIIEDYSGDSCGFRFYDGFRRFGLDRWELFIVIGRTNILFK